MNEIRTCKKDGFSMVCKMRIDKRRGKAYPGWHCPECARRLTAAYKDAQAAKMGIKRRTVEEIKAEAAKREEARKEEAELRKLEIILNRADFKEARARRAQVRRHQYYLANKEKFMRRAMARYHARVKSDPNLLLRLRHRSCLSSMLNGTKKSAPMLDLLGIGLEGLWLHLESQFRPGMNRANRGTVWHVDHIVPLSAFDLSRADHKAAAFHYSNLQPLYAHENWCKRAQHSRGDVEKAIQKACQLK